jgi:acyl-CoA thioesterase FadM
MRVKIVLPETPPIFTTEFTLGVADMNYGNHLGNDRVLTLAHETRLRYMATYQETELTFCGGSLIMADAAIQYRGQGFMGDKLVAKLWLENPTGYGFDFIVHLHHQDDAEVARVKCALLFYDYEKNKMIKAPPKFKERYSS